MWSFDNIQVSIALTRQGFVSTLYFLPYPGFSGMGNVKCTGGASGFKCLSGLGLFGMCRTSGVPWLVRAPVFGAAFYGCFSQPWWTFESPLSVLSPCLLTGRWCPQGCSRVKGDLLMSVCLHGISKELLSVPFLSSHVPEAVQIHLFPSSPGVAQEDSRSSVLCTGVVSYQAIRTLSRELAPKAMSNSPLELK